MAGWDGGVTEGQQHSSGVCGPNENVTDKTIFLKNQCQCSYMILRKFPKSYGYSLEENFSPCLSLWT